MDLKQGAHPLVLLALAFALEMCSSASSSDTTDAGATDAGASVDSGPVVSCKSISDCVPRPSECLDTQTLAYYSADRCEGGRCYYTQSTSGCSFGFCSGHGCTSTDTTGGSSAYECVTDSDCTPTASYCLDSSTLAYDKTSCVNGTCIHTQQTTGCPCYTNGCYTGGTTGGVGGWSGDDAQADAPGDAAQDAPGDAAGDAAPD